MSGEDSEQITCRMITKPALHLMDAQLPLSLIDKVNDYIDGVRDTARDSSPMLVGQIKRDKRSAQLQMDLKEKMPGILAGVIVQIAQQYIKEQGFRAEVTPGDMWSIHSYEGDYNPLHDHGAKTNLGLSCVLYLMVPPAIAEKRAVPDGAAPRLTMASGNCDGFTQFVWGATAMKDFSLLRPPTQQYVKPEVGRLIVFPNWLLHGVHPFFGEGERRTLSLNMDVAFNEPDWY